MIFTMYCRLDLHNSVMRSWIYISIVIVYYTVDDLYRQALNDSFIFLLKENKKEIPKISSNCVMSALPIMNISLFLPVFATA